MSDIVERLRKPMVVGMTHPIDAERAEAAAEIERLRAYAKHEFSLGAEGPMIELTNARQEIERLRGERASDQQRLFHYEAEIERLRAALKPFTSLTVPYYVPDAETVVLTYLGGGLIDVGRSQQINVGSIRNARRALEGK